MSYKHNQAKESTTTTTTTNKQTNKLLLNNSIYFKYLIIVRTNNHYKNKCMNECNIFANSIKVMKVCETTLMMTMTKCEQ